MHFDKRGRRYQLQRDDERQHDSDGKLQPGGNYIDYRDAEYGNDWHTAAIYGHGAWQRQLQHWRDVVAGLFFLREFELWHAEHDRSLHHALSGSGICDSDSDEHYDGIHERERQRDRDVERADDRSRAGT
jgi:hypothetical protein